MANSNPPNQRRFVIISNTVIFIIFGLFLISSWLNFFTIKLSMKILLTLLYIIIIIYSRWLIKRQDKRDKLR